MIFDENIAPRSGTSSKLRQSCPAQLSSNSFGSSGSSILHESTRNFNNIAQSSQLGQSQSLSKSSFKQITGFSSSSGYEQSNHLSQSSYRQSEPILAKGNSVLSSVSSRSSVSVRSSTKGEDSSSNNNQYNIGSTTSSKRNSGVHLNEVDENNNLSMSSSSSSSSSRLRSSVQNQRNSLNPASAILSTISQEESGSSFESGNISQRQSLNSSSMRKHSVQESEQLSVTQRMSAQQQIQQKPSKGNIALKLGVLTLMFAIGLAVIVLNPSALESIQGSYSPENKQQIAMRNKYFEAQIDETLNDNKEMQEEQVERDENVLEGQKENQLESTNGKKGDSTYVEAIPFVKESTQTTGGRIGSYSAAAAPSSISQGSEAKLETLIEEEAESFYQTLVKVVQKEKSISWQQFEEYLVDNGTASIIDRVRVKIQRRVDESLSIKEELNIQTGGRFYVSQEKL